MSEQRYYFGIPFEVRAPKAEPKFKVGDRVRVVKVGEGGSFHGAKVGETDTLMSVYDFGKRVEGNNWFYNANEIELIEPPFAVGDHVKLLRHFGAHARGDAGQVYSVETVQFGYDVGVAMDPYGVYSVFPAECLEKLAADCAERKEQPKFKAGDWVRCLRGCDGQFTKGDFYQVREVPSDGWLSFVLDDLRSKTNGWGAKNFELVTAADCPQDNVQQTIPACPPSLQPAIVARVLDGQPRPSNIPFVHANADAALTEAERLAKNNPGQEFAVYQRVGARVAEVSYNMKEVA